MELTFCAKEVNLTETGYSLHQKEQEAPNRENGGRECALSAHTLANARMDTQARTHTNMHVRAGTCTNAHRHMHKRTHTHAQSGTPTHPATERTDRKRTRPSLDTDTAEQAGQKIQKINKKIWEP